MGRYFGREPRYTREELERQAQEAIDARIALGRPPAEEFLPVQQRLAAVDRADADRLAGELAPDSQPLRIHQVHSAAATGPAPVPSPAPAAAPEPAPAPDPAPAAERQPVAAARPTSN